MVVFRRVVREFSTLTPNIPPPFEKIVTIIGLCLGGYSTHYMYSEAKKS